MNTTRRIIRAALKRQRILQGEMLRMACISPSTYADHVRADRLTQAELRRMDRVVKFTNEELITLIRGGAEN